MNQFPSYYQPYESLGALTVVDVDKIQQEENLDYLEHLCGFIQKMKLNPLWFDHQQNENKLKIIHIYQLAINYSKNLFIDYDKKIKDSEDIVNRAKGQIDDRIQRIKNHKEQVKKMKEKYKKRKHKLVKFMYKNMKQKMDVKFHNIQDEMEDQQYQRYQRGQRRRANQPHNSSNVDVIYYYPGMRNGVPDNYHQNFQPYPQNQRIIPPNIYQQPYPQNYLNNNYVSPDTYQQAPSNFPYFTSPNGQSANPSQPQSNSIERSNDKQPRMSVPFQPRQIPKKSNKREQPIPGFTSFNLLNMEKQPNHEQIETSQIIRQGSDLLNQNAQKHKEKNRLNGSSARNSKQKIRKNNDSDQSNQSLQIDELTINSKKREKGSAPIVQKQSDSNIYDQDIDSIANISLGGQKSNIQTTDTRLGLGKKKPMRQPSIIIPRIRKAEVINNQKEDFQFDEKLMMESKMKDKVIHNSQTNDRNIRTQKNNLDIIDENKINGKDHPSNISTPASDIAGDKVFSAKPSRNSKIADPSEKDNGEISKQQDNVNVFISKIHKNMRPPSKKEPGKNGPRETEPNKSQKFYLNGQAQEDSLHLGEFSRKDNQEGNKKDFLNVPSLKKSSNLKQEQNNIYASKFTGQVEGQHVFSGSGSSRLKRNGGIKKENKQQENIDIFKSNMKGSKQSGISQIGDKAFSGQVKRHSEIQKNQKVQKQNESENNYDDDIIQLGKQSNINKNKSPTYFQNSKNLLGSNTESITVKQSLQMSKQPIKPPQIEEDDKQYQNDFQLDDLDMGQLQASHLPIKQPKIEDAPVIKTQKSRVNINLPNLPSSQDFPIKNQYLKLQNQEFTLKQRVMENSQYDNKISESDNLFDLMEIPAQSRMAQRPSIRFDPKSRMMEKSKAGESSKRIEQLRESDMVETGGIVINLILPSGTIQEIKKGKPQQKGKKEEKLKNEEDDAKSMLILKNFESSIEPIKRKQIVNDPLKDPRNNAKSITFDHTQKNQIIKDEEEEEIDEQLGGELLEDSISGVGQHQKQQLEQKILRLVRAANVPCPLQEKDLKNFRASKIDEVIISKTKKDINTIKTSNDWKQVGDYFQQEIIKIRAQLAKKKPVKKKSQSEQQSPDILSYSNSQVNPTQLSRKNSKYDKKIEISNNSSLVPDQLAVSRQFKDIQIRKKNSDKNSGPSSSPKQNQNKYLRNQKQSKNDNNTMRGKIIMGLNEGGKYDVDDPLNAVLLKNQSLLKKKEEDYEDDFE